MNAVVANLILEELRAIRAALEKQSEKPATRTRSKASKKKTAS